MSGREDWRSVMTDVRAEIVAGLTALMSCREELDEFRSPASDKTLAQKEALLERIDRVLAAPDHARTENLNKPGWKAEEVDELRRLAGLRTMTASQIGEAMGRSRGSIISKAHRSNIPLLDRASGYEAGHRSRVERAARASEPPAPPAKHGDLTT